nr:MAG TPA: hypothetical protein [Caudoviricetes sp.]
MKQKDPARSLIYGINESMTDGEPTSKANKMTLPMATAAAKSFFISLSPINVLVLLRTLSVRCFF